MTIALGILAREGVVIAADTQESWGYMGGAKISGYKILTCTLPHQGRACSATGAGSAGYIDALNQELTDNFIAVEDPENIERRFREKVLKFYNAHVLPNHALSPMEQPRADVIVGITWAGRKPVLLANERSTLRRCKQYVAVGAGREHASMLLSRLLPPPRETTADVAALIAAYTIFHVKSYIEGCGMGTHVTVLQDGIGKYLSPTAVERLEGLFTAYLRFDELAVTYMLGWPVINEQQTDKTMIDYLKSLRKGTLGLPHLALTAGEPNIWEPPGFAILNQSCFVQVAGEAVTGAI